MTSASTSRSFTRRVRAAAFAVSVAALAACSGGSGTDSESVSTDRGVGADVVVRGVSKMAWDKKAYSVKQNPAGIEIYVSNDSLIPHNLYVEDQNGRSLGDAVDLQKKGDTGRATYDLEPGVYFLTCRLNGHRDMKSVLTVE